MFTCPTWETLFKKQISIQWVWNYTSESSFIISSWESLLLLDPGRRFGKQCLKRTLKLGIKREKDVKKLASLYLHEHCDNMCCFCHCSPWTDPVHHIQQMYIYFSNDCENSKLGMFLAFQSYLLLHLKCPSSATFLGRTPIYSRHSSDMWFTLNPEALKCFGLTLAISRDSFFPPKYTHTPHLAIAHFWQVGLDLNHGSQSFS